MRNPCKTNTSQEALEIKAAKLRGEVDFWKAAISCGVDTSQTARLSDTQAINLACAELAAESLAQLTAGAHQELAIEPAQVVELVAEVHVLAPVVAEVPVLVEAPVVAPVVEPVELTQARVNSLSEDRAVRERAMTILKGFGQDPWSLMIAEIEAEKEAALLLDEPSLELAIIPAITSLEGLRLTNLGNACDDGYLRFTGSKRAIEQGQREMSHLGLTARVTRGDDWSSPYKLIIPLQAEMFRECEQMLITPVVAQFQSAVVIVVDPAVAQFERRARVMKDAEALEQAMLAEFQAQAQLQPRYQRAA